MHAPCAHMCASAARARCPGATARPTRFSGCRAECGFGLPARSPLRRGRLRRILHAGGDASKRAGKARQASFPRLEGRTTMRRAIPFAACAAALSLGAIEAQAQSGSVEKAVGGYGFEEAAAEAPGTKDFHSADGHLTFAIVTHTAGNGFFDPVYVGAKVAGDLIGANILLLGSESPTDDPAREIEILNQIVQDPTHRRPDHDDAAGRRLQRHRQGGRGGRHPGRHHQLVRRHHPEPQRHQPHRPGRLRRRDRRRGAGRSAWRTRASNQARSCCPPRPRWATSR